MPPETTLTISDFFDAWELYEPGVVSAIVIGATLGVLGVYVVLRRLVFLSAAIGQAASFGVVLSLLVFGAALGGSGNPPPIVLAIVVSFVATAIVGRGGRGGGSPVLRDGVLGAVFLVGAAGTILIGSRLTHEMHEIEALLHGVGVAVLPEDLTMVLWVSGSVLLVHILGWRGFQAVAFDPIGARVRGVPVLAFELSLALTLASAIAGGIRVLGALPVFALSILPSLASVRVSRNIPESLVIGGLFGALAGLYGYLFAFLTDLPVGASQTAMALVLVVIVVGSRRLARLGAPRLWARHPSHRNKPWVAPLLGRLAVGLVVVAVLTALGPLRVALDGGSNEPFVFLGVALGALAAVVAATAREWLAVLPGMVVALVGLVLATLVWQPAEDWSALVRPLVQTSALVALAACAREAHHRVLLESALPSQ